MSDSEPTRHERHNAGLEFDRAAFFSDAVYAIAMTLLVVGIGVPHVSDAHLGRALSNLDDSIVSFFIGFFVLGYYWISHHQMFSQLRAVNTPLLVVNLVYLAVIAFLPFPTAIVGVNGDAPLAFVLFAGCLAAVSILEVAIYLCAIRYDLLRERPDAGPAAPRRHRRPDPGGRRGAVDPVGVREHQDGLPRLAPHLPGRDAARPVRRGSEKERRRRHVGAGQ